MKDLIHLIHNDWLRLRRSVSPVLLLLVVAPLGGAGVLAGHTLPASTHAVSQYAYVVLMAVILGRFTVQSPEFRFLRAQGLPRATLTLYAAAQILYVLVLLAVIPYATALFTAPAGWPSRIAAVGLYLTATIGTACLSAALWLQVPPLPDGDPPGVRLEGFFRRLSPVVALECSLWLRHPAQLVSVVAGCLLWVLWPLVTSFIGAMLIGNFLFLHVLPWSYTSFFLARGPLPYRLAGLPMLTWLSVRAGLLAGVTTLQMAGYLVGIWLGGPPLGRDWDLLGMFAILTCVYGPLVGTGVAAAVWTPRLTLPQQILHGFALVLAWLLAWLGLAMVAGAEVHTGLPVPELFTALLVGLAGALLYGAARRLERMSPV